MIKTDNKWIWAEDFCKYKGLSFKNFLSQDVVTKFLDNLIVAYGTTRDDFVHDGKISHHLAPLFATFSGVKSICKPAEQTYSLRDYMKEEVQLTLSKKVNAKMLAETGVAGMATYNRNSAENATGFRPSDLQTMARAKGELTRDYNSGKQYIRKSRPHLAAIMAASDDLVLQGIEPNEAFALAKDLEQHFLKLSRVA